jgi:hypothetical protein
VIIEWIAADTREGADGDTVNVVWAIVMEYKKDQPTGQGKGRKAEENNPSPGSVTGFPLREIFPPLSFFSCQRTRLLQTFKNPVFQGGLIE